MAWYTEYLRDETRLRAQLQEEFPYLTALFASKQDDSLLVRNRFRNYLTARHCEQTKPLFVTSFPYHVVLDPCNLCNLRCPLCVQATDNNGRQRQMISRDGFSSLVRDLRDSIIRLDLFNWGEPLLHPELPELVKVASTQSIYTRTSSHLSYPKGVRAESLVDAGLDYLVVSLDGITQKTYERYRVGGDLNAVLQNLEHIIAVRENSGTGRPLIEWQYLVFQHNICELDQARQAAREIGVDIFRYGGARGQMSTKLLTDSATNVHQSGDFLIDPTHPLSEYDMEGNKLRTEETKRCKWLWGKIALNPDGGVSPCWSSWFKSFDFGSWNTNKLAEIWNSQTYQQARFTATHGGGADGALICDSCAFHKSFVPPPDQDSEPIPNHESIRGLIGRAVEAGIRPSVEVVRAIEEELEF